MTKLILIFTLIFTSFTVITAEQTGDLQQTVKVKTTTDFRKKLPKATRLDSFRLLAANPDKFVVYVKRTLVVPFSVEDFGQKIKESPEHLKKVFDYTKVERTPNPSYFTVESPLFRSPMRLELFMDSDDISEIPDPKILQSINRMRELNPRTKSATSIIFKGFFAGNDLKAFALLSYGSVSSKQTLAIGYYFILTDTEAQAKAIQKIFESSK